VEGGCVCSKGIAGQECEVFQLAPQHRLQHLLPTLSCWPQNTIEENILRKSDQKRQLDWLAIQSGKGPDEGMHVALLSVLDRGAGMHAHVCPGIYAD
jgi:hypothetical protein